MSASDPSGRHLTTDSFREYVNAGAPSVLKIDGSPIMYLVINPAPQRIALRAPLTQYGLPDVSGYRYLSAATIHWNDTQWCDLRIDGDIMFDAYPIVCAIADRVQLMSMDFGSAVLEALDALRQLLAGRGMLSEEQEIGLFGELLVLRHLLRRLPAADALTSWRGPAGEEHDFALPDADVEVKSTTSELRSHWIGDLRQLQPSPGRRLVLLSIQLTGAGPEGASLAELIGEVCDLVSDAAAKAELRRRLDYPDRYSTAHPRRFRLRTTPAIFDVDSEFPAITPGRLEAAGLDRKRFRQVRYLIELDGYREAADVPDLVAGVGVEAHG
jgi:putative PD-(D/E)XK family protein DUF4420